MEKLIKILKNTLMFFVIFLAINYLMQSCQNPEETLAPSDGNLIFLTSDNEYGETEKVSVKLENNTLETIVIPNECPNEPFNVYHYQNNDWVQKTISPELNCENAKDISLEAGKDLTIEYDNWSNALFAGQGRFRIEFETEIGGEKKTITTNEFVVVDDGVFRQLTVGLFYRPIYNGLIFIVAMLPGHNLGLAIILLTLLIRTILLIPSQKAIRSQKRMQEIQPRLQKIRDKHKGDQQKIAMETMAIWKEAKINPFGSCLPMLMQFPFLIALFYVIKGGLNPDNAHLLYSTYNDFNLADINVIFLGILDLTKVNIYVLPLIIGGLQFIQMKLTMARKPKNKKKKDEKDQMAIATGMMTYVMPVMIAVFTASLPAGVGIYWGTSTFYGIMQQLVVNKTGSKKPDEPTVKVIEKSD